MAKMSLLFLSSPPILFFTLLGFLTGGAGASDFRCPEEFGYYQHPTECSLYYVCVFGGPLLESCTGGLVYSHDLQTCDWPRNVACQSVVSKPETESSEIEAETNVIVTDSKKDVKTYSSRVPRKQNSHSSSKLSSFPSPVRKSTSR